MGVDYAEGMLALARQRVAAAGADNVRLVAGNICALDHLGRFDAVLCVLGIFFVDDMPAAARSLWSAVRPGGRLVATFGTQVWSPVLEEFLRVARRERPDVPQVLPWRRTDRPEVLADVLTRGGVPHAGVASEVVDGRLWLATGDRSCSAPDCGGWPATSATPSTACSTRPSIWRGPGR